MRILITGAEQGLGAMMMSKLQAEGHTVQNIPREVLEFPDHLHAWIELKNMELAGNGKGWDILISNFGMNHLSEIGRTEVGDINLLYYNTFIPYWLVNCLVSVGSKPMRVLCIASQTYRVAQRTTSLYCASKAGLVQLVKVMARELAPKGWIINCLAPGKMPDTEMSILTDAQVLELRGWSAEDAEAYALSNIPMGRFTDTNEVSEAALAILKLPDYINGTCIDMTGGI